MAVTIIIADVDHTLDVEPTSFSLNRALTNQVDTVRFNVVRKGGASGGDYKPSELDDVKIYDGTQELFGGQIVEIDSQVIEASDIEVFSCVAKDYSYDMDRFLVISTYKDVTIESIISDIATNIMPSGYDVSNVSCPIIAHYVAFNYEYPSKCFQQLAELVNYDWYVDANKKIFFFEKSTYPSPFNLTDTSDNYYFNTLVLKNNVTSLRNSVIVRGGTYLGLATSESVIADGTQTAFKQGYSYHSIYVNVNSVAQTVGIANIDDPTLYDCLYDFSQRFVIFPDATKPVSGDIVQVGGYPYIPVIVKVRNYDSILQNGEHQFKIIDKSIDSKEGARDRAKAEIVAYGSTINDGSFETSTAGLDVGQQINIQSTIRGINTDYVISRITTRMRNAQEFKHNVTLVTSKTYGMIQFLMQLLLSKDKEIVIKSGEVTDEVESSNEIITFIESDPVVSISHTPQDEVATIAETNTVQALDYATIFVVGSGDGYIPTTTSRQFVLNGSPLG